MRTSLRNYIEQTEQMFAHVRDLSERAMESAGKYEQWASDATDSDRRERCTRGAELMRDHAKMYARHAEEISAELDRLREIGDPDDMEMIG